GIADGIGAYIFGIDYAFTLGVIAAFTELIPYLGPFLGGIPAVIIALIISPWKALEIAVWYTIVQELEAHIVVPKVMEKEMGLHPLIVLFSILAFGKLFGFWGVLFAVPLAAIIKIIIKVYFPHIWEKGGQ
ncbi:MAG: AI-2E family transporter, partial [bacterium]